MSYIMELLLNICSLITFFGSRHVVSDLYNHNYQLLCNPFVKIFILFSIIYMNMKDIKISIILFFMYLFVIDNYVVHECKLDKIFNY